MFFKSTCTLGIRMLKTKRISYNTETEKHFWLFTKMKWEK